MVPAEPLLADSNIIIYAIQPQYPALRRLLQEHDVAISGVTYVEVL